MYSFQLVLVLYLAAVTPELISRDIRNRTLPLYFSRPLRRTDYPIAKVSALITAMLVLTAVPELLLYVGTIGSLHGGSAVWHETRPSSPAWSWRCCTRSSSASWPRSCPATPAAAPSPPAPSRCSSSAPGSSPRRWST